MFAESSRAPAAHRGTRTRASVAAGFRVTRRQQAPRKQCHERSSVYRGQVRVNPRFLISNYMTHRQLRRLEVARQAALERLDCQAAINATATMRKAEVLGYVPREERPAPSKCRSL